MSQEYECVLEEALRELDESNVDQGYIDIIRMACGKPLRSVSDLNNELLDGMFKDFETIFKGKPAPFKSGI